MAKASLDSSGPFHPVRMVMPKMEHPTVCGRHGCAHLQCIAARHQADLPCCYCKQLIEAGEVLLILTRTGVVVQRQCHDRCYPGDLG